MDEKETSKQIQFGMVASMMSTVQDDIGNREIRIQHKQMGRCIRSGFLEEVLNMWESGKGMGKEWLQMQHTRVEARK